MKKIFWTVLVTSASALGARLAVRGVQTVWTRIAGEAPPEPPWWARFLVGKPVKAGVKSAVPAPPA
jgi:hypothetical protein